MATIRSESVPGLIFTPGLAPGLTRTGQQRVSVNMTFYPSLGIMARRVEKLGMDIRSFREPLKRAIQKVIIPSIAMNFHKHGRVPPGSNAPPGRWAELAESTIAQKGHSRPLLLTGELQKTMRQFNIWHVDHEKALLANLPQNVWYGVVHQQGMESWDIIEYREAASRRLITEKVASQGSVPARPFVVLQPEDEEAIEEIFLDWLDERAMRAGWPTTARSKILTGDF